MNKSQAQESKKYKNRLLPKFTMDQKVKVIDGFFKGKFGIIRGFFPGELEEQEDGEMKILYPSTYLVITSLYDSIKVEEKDIEIIKF